MRDGADEGTHTPLTVFSTESPGPESSLDLEDLLGFHLCLVASWDSSSWGGDVPGGGPP